MSFTLKSRTSGETIPEYQGSASEVEGELAQILESHHFRTSKQCQDLLRYLVENSARDDDSALKERVVGVEVFGRKPSYDTNEDPVVRVRAADVRKRLAQYYQSVSPGTSTVRIELQPGSYRVHFRHEGLPARPPHAPESRLAERVLNHAAIPARSRRENILPFFGQHRRIFLLVAVALAVAVGVSFDRSFWSSPQERFWTPLITAKQPVLIYLGTNAAYVFSSSFQDQYRAAHGLPNNGPEFYIDLPPGSSVRAEDIVPVKDTFVTTADVTAIVRLTTMLRGWDRPFVLRSGRDLSFGDLRGRPSVMIGAFNNSWTIELTSDLPYSFRHGVQIYNRDHPDKSWSVPVDSRNSTTEDYAVITRLVSAKTGGPAITAAGIGEYGTLAAAEFLANPDQMRELLKSAPRGWESKNMQAVLRVKVLDYQPVSTEIVATSYW